MRTTVTISRQLGCGGSYIGRLIASNLGLKYVDREVLHLAAEEFGCDVDLVLSRKERVSSFWEKVFGGLKFGSPESPYVPPPLRDFSDKQLFDKQTEILKRIAANNDCVVIGWAGVHVLRPHPKMFSVFCHAPAAFRVQRIMDLNYAPDKETALEMIRESDEMRKKYFTAMTGHDWECASNYHLSIDTSLLPLEETAKLVMDLLARRNVVKVKC